MHYRNGREAKNGDKVVLFSGYAAPVVGILYGSTAGNDYCNGRIAVIHPNDLCPNLQDCIHLDDVLALLPSRTDVLADTHPDIFKQLALVPDKSKKGS